MNYVDFTIAASFFLIFFALAIMFTTNYFSNLSSLTKTTEFRSTSEDFFRLFFESKGVPKDWNKNYTIVPVKIGLAEDLYLTRVLVRENAGLNRTNEPVSAHIIFDENCQNKSRNNTIRLYDEDWNELNIEIANTTNCSNTYLNQTDISWELNISANQTKKYWVYYSPDETITAKVYSPLQYNTSSWIPSDGDNWTESSNNWIDGSWGNSSVSSITTDTDRKKGSYSINIKGISVDDWLRAKYNESGAWNISEFKNIVFWFKVNNTQNNRFMVWLESGSGGYNKSFESYVLAPEWYKITLPLSEFLTYGSGYSLENIDNITIGCFNDSNNVSFEFKVDNLHFEKEPLEVKVFPEEHILAVSSSKFDVLQNISYDEARKSVGENYKFRMEVGNETYGGDFNKSANVGCCEYPKVMVSKNGTISKSLVRMCVWK
ncbi:MAG: hypothetical protein QMD36_00780 [Candidatus Aenigmarchaeota archaeon]|nr:hypothetical protein [Candidatus Aenigmarchaeota archaeon]